MNELKGGWQWSPNWFNAGVSAGMFADQGGYRLDFPLITDPSVANHNAPAPRNTVNWNIDDTLNWLKGSHSFSFGGSFLQLTHNQQGWNLVPTLTIAVDQTNDPANAMFNSANFPGASTAALTEARNIYAILTGRVTAVTGNARLDPSTGEYVYLGNLFERSRMNSVCDVRAGLVARVAGGDGELRAALGHPAPVHAAQQRLVDRDDGRSLRRVGHRIRTGRAAAATCSSRATWQAAPASCPSYTAFTPGTSGYKTDWNNFAPNAGVAWRPNVQGGFLRRLLGDPDQATVRAGYAVSYSLERLDRFSSLYGDNPGGEIAATRNYTTGFPMLGPGETAPVLLRDRSRLGPPAFPASPVYPIAALPSNELNVFDAEHRHAVRAVVLGRLPALARPRHGARSALRRQPQSPRLGGRGLERRDALRERLHRRVQGRAGEPRRARRAGLRRRPAPARSRIAAREPARRRCRSTSRTSRA